MKKETTYPTSYQGIKLKWVNNEPKFKKGDSVIILRNNEYKQIVLDKVKQEPMQTRWLRACWGCRKPNPLTADKFVYRWNKGEFTESEQIDCIKELNKLSKRLIDSNKENEELSNKADLYDQIKASLNGEIIERY